MAYNQQHFYLWQLSKTFAGYNFKSLREISPYLEPTGSGLSSCWAKNTALNYDCTVIAGYPEKVDVTDKWPADPEYYNSAVVVNSDGETIANYQKTHLYYTDETWALEGPNGFYKGRIPGIGRTAIGICMDIKLVVRISIRERIHLQELC